MRYKFNEIAINSVEKRIPTEDDKANYIGLEHLESGSLSVSTWGSAVSLKGEKLVMRKGDVLFGKRNTYLRRASIAPHDGLFSAHGMVLRPKPEVIDPSFFPFFVNSDEFFNSTIRISVGSLSPTVNWKDMKELEFDLPPIEKQRELAELLWAANDLKESYKKLIAATDEMLKAKFREMFEEKDVKYPLRELGELFDVGSSKRVFEKDWKTEGVPFYRAREVVKLAESGYVDNELYISEEMYEEYVGKYGGVKEGDILVTGVGTLGVCYLVKASDQFYYKDGNCICLHTTGAVDSRYVVWCFKMPHVRNQIAAAEARKTTVGTYTIEAAKRTTIPLPPLALQQEFVEIARKADETKAALKKSIADVESVIKGLING